MFSLTEKKKRGKQTHEGERETGAKLRFSASCVSVCLHYCVHVKEFLKQITPQHVG